MLSYRVLTRADSGGTATVAPDATLPTGTHLVFEVRASEPAYLVLAQHRAGAAQPVILFPDPQIAIANPLPADTWVRIPPEPIAYRLDEHDVGRETVYLVASRREPRDLAAAIADQGKHPASRAVSDALISIAMTGRPDCAGRARQLTLDTGGDCAVTARALVLDAPPTTDRAARAVRAVDAAEDLVFVPFSFQHVAAPP